MAYIPQTYPNSVTDTTPPFQYDIPLTAIRVASSWRAIMSSVMGSDLSSKYFTPTHVRYDPLIYAGCVVQSTKTHTSGFKPSSSIKKSEAKEQKGNLIISDLCNNGTDSVHDISVVNTDAKSCLTNTQDRCLQDAAKVKKKIYL